MARPASARILARCVVLAALGAATLYGLGLVHLGVPSADTIREAGLGALSNVAAWAQVGYERRPAVMIGLAGIIALPVIALLGLAVHLALSRPGRVQPLPAGPSQDVPRAAWVRVRDDSATPVEIRRDLVQIGRESDNDICLADATVHRYHAVIERSADLGFVITDVSGPAGNGIRVNGMRTARARLADGDVVELGKAQLEFAMAA